MVTEYGHETYGSGVYGGGITVSESGTVTQSTEKVVPETTRTTTQIDRVIGQQETSTIETGVSTGSASTTHETTQLAPEQDTSSEQLTTAVTSLNKTASVGLATATDSTATTSRSVDLNSSTTAHGTPSISNSTIQLATSTAEASESLLERISGSTVALDAADAAQSETATLTVAQTSDSSIFEDTETFERPADTVTVVQTAGDTASTAEASSIKTSRSVTSTDSTRAVDTARYTATVQQLSSESGRVAVDKHTVVGTTTPAGVDTTSSGELGRSATTSTVITRSDTGSVGSTPSLTSDTATTCASHTDAYAGGTQQTSSIESIQDTTRAGEHASFATETVHSQTAVSRSTETVTVDSTPRTLATTWAGGSETATTSPGQLWEPNDVSVATELDRSVQQSVVPNGTDNSRTIDTVVTTAQTAPTAIEHSTARSHGASSTGRKATARDHTRAGDSPLTSTRSSTTALEATIASVVSKAISQATVDTDSSATAVDTASTTPSTTQQSLSTGTSDESSTTRAPSRMDLLVRSGAAIAPTILSNTTLANTEGTAATEQGSSAAETASTVDSHTRSTEHATTSSTKLLASEFDHTIATDSGTSSRTRTIGLDTAVARSSERPAVVSSQRHTAQTSAHAGEHGSPTIGSIHKMIVTSDGSVFSRMVTDYGTDQTAITASESREHALQKAGSVQTIGDDSMGTDSGGVNRTRSVSGTESTTASENTTTVAQQNFVTTLHTRSTEYGATLQFVTPTGLDRPVAKESSRTTHDGRFVDLEETALSTDAPRTTSYTIPETVPTLSTATEDARKTGAVSHNVLDTTSAQSVHPYTSTTSARSVVTTSTALGYDDGSVAVRSQLALLSDVPSLSRLFQLDFQFRNDETSPTSQQEVRIESGRTDSVRIVNGRRIVSIER